jgi:hypothetical protein
MTVNDLPSFEAHPRTQQIECLSAWLRKTASHHMQHTPMTHHQQQSCQINPKPYCQTHQGPTNSCRVQALPMNPAHQACNTHT